MAYFHHICSKPWEKTKVVLFFVQKEQQTGRGIFFNFLIKYLFGPQLGIAINSMSAMGKEWNQWLVGKLFVFIDELSTKHGEYHDIWDKMKSYVTDPVMQIFERHKNELNTHQVPFTRRQEMRVSVSQNPQPAKRGIPSISTS